MRPLTEEEIGEALAWVRRHAPATHPAARLSGLIEAIQPLTPHEAGAIQAVSEAERLKLALEPFMSDLRRDVEEAEGAPDNQQMTHGRLYTVGEVRALVATYDGTTPAARVFTEAEVRAQVEAACDEQDADLRGPDWIRETILSGLKLD